jgi:hypothetical protein
LRPDSPDVGYISRTQGSGRSVVDLKLCLPTEASRVAEPMIDLHQALYDTKMIEMLRCHLDVPLGKKVQWS